MEAAPNIAWLAANYSTLLCYTVHTSKPHVPVQCACTTCLYHVPVRSARCSKDSPCKTSFSSDFKEVSVHVSHHMVPAWRLHGICTHIYDLEGTHNTATIKTHTGCADLCETASSWEQHDSNAKVTRAYQGSPSTMAMTPPSLKTLCASRRKPLVPCTGIS